MRFSAVFRDGDSAMNVTPLASSDLQSWSDIGLTETVTNVDQTDVPDGFRRRAWQASGTSTTLFIRFRLSYE